MNLGQTLITLGMFVLLIMSVISANRMLMENSQMQLQAEALASSSTIANALFREIVGKPFDQKVVMDTTKTPWRQDTTGTKITDPKNLSADPGPMWGVRGLITLPDTSYNGNYRSITYLKDIDDYDGYIRILNFGNIMNDTVSVAVTYIDYTAPDVPTTTRAFFKRVEITVKQATYNLKSVYSTMVSY